MLSSRRVHARVAGKLPTVAPPLGPEELDPCPAPLWMESFQGPPPDLALLLTWLVEGKRVGMSARVPAGAVRMARGGAHKGGVMMLRVLC